MRYLIQIIEFGRFQIITVFVLVGVLWSSAPARPNWPRLLRKSDEWYRSAEGRRIADNILSWQSVQGSWPKNGDTTVEPFTADANEIRGTFDNRATVGEMRFLARAFNAMQDVHYKQAFLKGLDHIFEAQYPTGGWPQSYPPGDGYHRHITFNDGTMVRLMWFVREVATSADYQFIDADRRRAAQTAFDRGIQCILKCQISVNGKLTVWCAQHDEVDYSPCPARVYELVSLSGAESAGILWLLMSIDNPGPDVIRAIEAGAQWFESAKLTGIRQVRISGDRVIVKDPNAPPLWARFYEIGTNRPIFAGRDGIKRYDMAEIEAERRIHYAWYGSWGESVARGYVRWKEKWLDGAAESFNPETGPNSSSGIVPDSEVEDIAMPEPRQGRAKTGSSAGTVYLFSSFRKNGEDGLLLAYSFDGYNWTDLGCSFLKPEVGKHRFMRDPSVVRGPDGKFHMVWTTGWRDDKGFGYACSKDLIHWSQQKFVEAMASEPDTYNVWAPELFYDEENKRFIICWASTIPGRYPDYLEAHDNNHRLYYTTTKDFETFTDTKLLFEPGFSVIDGVIVRFNDRYILVHKDNTRPLRNLRVAFGDSALGPFTNVSEPFTERFTEGPSVLRLGDEWVIYFDMYRKDRFGAVKTRDFKTWTDITSSVSFPEGYRHGTVFKAPLPILEGLKRFSEQAAGN